MTSRTPGLSLAALAVLVLSACSVVGGADDSPPVTGGTIELAVSETCTDVSDPQCVSVDGEHVVLPPAFERAGVEDAAVAEGEGRNAVDVTFSEDGEAVFHALTKKAARAGGSARLVIKIGGEMRAAVAVMQALEGDHLQIVLAPDDSAREVVDLIHGG